MCGNIRTDAADGVGREGLQPTTSASDQRGYLTFQQAADYLGYSGKAKREAARKFVVRNGVPKFWRGRAWLVKPEDLDKALRGESVVGS